MYGNLKWNKKVISSSLNIYTLYIYIYYICVSYSHIKVDICKPTFYFNLTTNWYQTNESLILDIWFSNMLEFNLTDLSLLVKAYSIWNVICFGQWIHFFGPKFGVEGNHC
jgi:hypothetical protein